MNNPRIIFFRAFLAIVAILNIVLLFGFDYHIPFITKDNYNVNKSESTESSTAYVTDSSAEGLTREEEDISGESKTGDMVSSTKEPQKEKKCVVVSKSNARIRSGPGTEYERLTSVSNGTILVIIGEEDGWYNVRLEDGTVGYVSKELVEIVYSD